MRILKGLIITHNHFTRYLLKEFATFCLLHDWVKKFSLMRDLTEEIIVMHDGYPPPPHPPPPPLLCHPPSQVSRSPVAQLRGLKVRASLTPTMAYIFSVSHTHNRTL